MAEISATMVKELRDRTGAGMMEAKKALTASGGDIDAAIKQLRESGALKAEKKAGRATNEGRVGAFVSADGRTAALVEVRCETDFVAKNPEFVAFVNKVAESVAKAKPTADVSGVSFVEGGTIEAAVKGKVMTIGENLQIGKATRMEAPAGFFGVYVHNNGKLAVLIKLKGEANEAGKAMAKQVAMHAAGHDPQPIALTRAEIPADAIAREKDIFRKQAEAEGKPANMLDKIADGKLNAFYRQAVLPEQMFVIDPKKTVADVVKQAGPFALEGFSIVAVGQA